MQTMKEFLPAFFSSLRRNGQIDLAMTLGRAAIREREDAWMPVLLMRTNRVQLWAESDSDRFHSWDALLNQLKSGQCTPILGSGLIDHIRGSRREIAQRWAEIYRYPMASQNTEDFPTVAQFLATKPKTSVMRGLNRVDSGPHPVKQATKRADGIRRGASLENDKPSQVPSSKAFK